MDEQAPTSGQSQEGCASSGPSPVGPSPDAPTPTASFPSAPRGPRGPRGPRRAGAGGPGVTSAAELFGLDWDSAAPAVLAVAAEACARVPEEWEVEGPGVSLSLGDAADLDPRLLEAMLGPGGLGGKALGAQFGQDAAADALRPGPILAALTEAAVAGAAFLTDDELTGALQAARRLETRAQWQQTTLVAEFARRRAAQVADAKARGVPKGRRPGEFPDDELAAELLITRNQADGRIEADLELTARLPRTYAGMANGTISGGRADTIAAATGFLSDQDAARADEILAAAAPGLRVDQLGRKAAALEMKLDPEAARIRKEHARNTRQRVEVRRELSGNASIAGRELDTASALACKAYIDAVAVRVRNHGGLDGPLSSIKALVMTELLQGRDPLNLILPKTGRVRRPEPVDPAPHDGNGGGASGHRNPAATANPEHPDYSDYPCCPGDPDDPGPDDCDRPDDPDDPGSGSPDDPRYAGPAGRPSWDADEAENAPYEDPDADSPDVDDADDPDEPARRGPLRPGAPAPLPASINLLVPIGALLGWSAAPAQANGIGLLDPAETRAIVQAASQHPRTRWCATIVDDDGTAIAHACARGRHPWTTPPGTSPPGTSPPGAAPPTPPTNGPGASAEDAAAAGDAPDAAQRARLHQLLTELKLAPELIARGQCDHRLAEGQYTPSRKLKHLLRARTATCDAPGCNAQAVYCDQDHTAPWPDGPTDQCNLGPKCRRHHRCKQAPGWLVEQSEPGVIRWTLPNGRSHTTTPTVYDP
jgi:hypothetical protein